MVKRSPTLRVCHSLAKPGRRVRPSSSCCTAACLRSRVLAMSRPRATINTSTSLNAWAILRCSISLLGQRRSSRWNLDPPRWQSRLSVGQCAQKCQTAGSTGTGVTRNLRRHRALFCNGSADSVFHTAQDIHHGKSRTFQPVRDSALHSAARPHIANCANCSSVIGMLSTSSMSIRPS